MDYDAELDEYDAEDVELGEEGDQLDQGDREALAQGTEQVRRQLGDEAGFLTDQQVQDALWYYYYDIDKSVDYLRKKFIAPPPPPPSKTETKKTKESKSISLLPRARSYDTSRARATDADVESLADGDGPRQMSSFGGRVSPPLDAYQELPPCFYFKGLPWLNVPKHREAVLLPPTTLPGGLLGGGEGTKVSKLQALAAARKKKTEGTKKPEVQEERAQKRFSNLSIHDQPSDENAKPTPGFLSKRQKMSEEASSGKSSGPTSRPEQGNPSNLRSNPSDPPASTPMEVDESYTKRSGQGTENAELERAYTSSLPPSAFASVLCGTPSNAAAASNLPLPYTTSALFNPAAFEEPSPDDVVMAAQSKGSRLAKSQ